MEEDPAERAIGERQSEGGDNEKDSGEFENQDDEEDDEGGESQDEDDGSDNEESHDHVEGPTPAAHEKTSGNENGDENGHFDNQHHDDEHPSMEEENPVTPAPLSPGLPTIEVPSSPQTPSSSSYNSPPPTHYGSSSRRLSLPQTSSAAISAAGGHRAMKYYFTERDFKLYSIEGESEPTLDFRKQKGLEKHHVASAGGSQPEQSPTSPQVQNQRAASTSPEPRDPNNPASSLFVEEHAVFLRLIQTAERENLRGGDISLVNQLRTKVLQEQEQYRRHQEMQALKMPGKYLYVNETINKLVEGHITLKRERILRQNKQHYRVIQPITLVSLPVTPQDPVLKHSSTLLERGCCRKFEEPNEKLRAQFPVDADYFPKESPQDTRAKVIPTVSEDPWITPLLDTHPADVVISSGGMVALFNTHGDDFGPDWDIPVIVRELTTASGEKRKVVFVDKPLLKRNLTSRERNQLYYDTAFEGLCLNSDDGFRIDFEQGKTASAAEESAPPPVNVKTDNLIYNLWTFGNTKILIRCKIHGVVRDPSSKYNQMRMVGIKTKLEMNYETGGAMEEVTIDETARWWIYTYIRPDAHLMLGRIDVHTSQILSVEKWDMPKILPPVCAYKPAAASKVFQIILEKIKEFDIGHYVISHKVGESSLTVYQSRDPPGEATSEQGKLPELVPARHWDLHASQKEAGASTQHIPYIPKRWAGPSTQIPFTFVPRKAKRKMFSHVCRTFSRTGVCTKLDCPYPHLFPSETGPHAFGGHSDGGEGGGQKKKKKKQGGPKEKKHKGGS